jgi:nucleoside 2-deoxyribosyltransferase
MRSVYLAAPLFSDAEKEFNCKLRDEIKKTGHDVFLPQEDSNNVKDIKNRQDIIFSKNIAAMDTSSVMVAVLDGADVDSGTAWEIGYAYSKGMPVFGLRTDFRTLGIEGMVNLMIERSVTMCGSIQELLNHLKSL